VPTGLDAPPPGYGPKPPRRRGWHWLLAAAAVMALAVVVGPFVYFHFVEGTTPARLQLPAATVGQAARSGPLGGIWTVTAGSEAGYRVRETLFGQSHTAVGRTSKVSGQMLISGTSVEAAVFQVDVGSIRSDQASRDAQFHGFIMESYKYHDAGFRLTHPIPFGSVPAPGRVVTAGATGMLTMRGVTRSVTFPVLAEHLAGAVDVNAEIPVRFSDWHIPNPTFAIAQVGDTGVIEVLLHLVPGTSAP
jgi:polyisoprenoid-binding protein YceI